MDIWAYCEPCDRWFYNTSGVERSLDNGRCPVCLSTPTAWVNRAQVVPAEIGRLAS